MPERLSEEAIQQIRARTEKASKGPWRVAYHGYRHVAGSPACRESCGKGHAVVKVEQLREGECHTTVSDTVDDIIGNDGEHVLCMGHDYDDYGVVSAADAEFMAHAREDVPALYHEIEELQKERDSYRELYQITSEALAKIEDLRLGEEVRRLRALCVRAADKLDDHQDEGPTTADGWQSKDLQALIKALKAEG